MSTAPTMKRPKTQDERDLLLYESRLQRPVRMKTPEFERNGRIRHVIFSGQFSVPFLEELGGIADMIRILSKSRAGQDFLINLLPHKRAMLYFTQPSTRTFLSFMAACQILGITCNEVRDPSTSSETKGETRFDSIRMFSSYFDTIIMRSPIARLAESCAYLMNDLDASGSRSVPIVNAGSGADEHPTQALLDIYTLQRSFQFASPKDSPGGQPVRRAARAEGLHRADQGPGAQDVRLLRRYRPRADGAVAGHAAGAVRRRAAGVHRAGSSEAGDARGLARAAGGPQRAVLRIRFVRGHARRPARDRAARRTLHDADPEGAQRSAGRGVVAQRSTSRGTASRRSWSSRMKEYAPILHPFPRDQHFGEIPPEIDNDPRAMYFRQARNGMWIRAALLAHIFDVDHLISRHFLSEYLERHNYND